MQENLFAALLGLTLLCSCSAVPRTLPMGLEAGLFPFEQAPHSEAWTATMIPGAEPLPYQPLILATSPGEAGWWNITMRNQGELTLRYSGYDREYPQMHQELWTPTGWARGASQWCGTGMEDYDWLPGETKTFQVIFGPAKVLQRISTRFWAKGTQPFEAFVLLQQIPNQPLANKPVVLSTQDVAPGVVGVTIQNQGKTTLSYFGYGRNLPKVVQELWAPEGWRQGRSEQGCGTCLDHHSLIPGESVTFHLSFWTANAQQRLSLHFVEDGSNRAGSVVLVNQLPFEAMPHGFSPLR